MLGCLLVVAAMIVPGAAGARTSTKQTELGELTVKGNDFALKLDGDASAVDPSYQAHAAGSSLGRVPSGCKQKRRKGARIVCQVKTIFAVDIVLVLWLAGAIEGDGSLACPLLIEAERIRLGGASLCRQRIAVDAPALANREPEAIYLEGTGFGRGATAEAVILLDHPADAVVVELAVTPKRYWRITDTSALYP